MSTPWDSPHFLSVLFAAQEGNQVAVDTVVAATSPMVYLLTSDEDERQELFCWLLSYTIPKYSFAQPWGVHVRVTLTSRLLTIRRTEQRYRRKFK